MTSVKKGVRFNPSEHIDPAPLQHHRDWMDLCLRTSTAKVLAIFGSEDKEYLTKKWGQRLEELKLWGAYQGFSLWILRPEGDNTRAERLVLFLWHPEYVTNKQSIEIGRKYDLVLRLAAQLAGITRTPGQISHNKDDCTNNGSLKRAAEEEDGEAKFAIIKRRKMGKNKDLETGDESRQVDRQFIPMDDTPFVTQDDLKRNNKSDNIQRRTNKARKVQGSVDSTEE
ncbi:hypothetical protein INS49_006579 [Diaporthe citri]|uniref:uncharacterized protein n=1 Tax=Diaporthe citri TaxID=83186 RepID=UPI001C826963|nr:uncharacterized protein INS49_006579 [Diaporthe citri]KAG6364974.1 hypothetical protein INS49_006579 [Diaporthe citri]